MAARLLLVPSHSLPDSFDLAAFRPSPNFFFMMTFPITIMAMTSYRNQAEVIVRDYLLSDPFIPYTSIIGGIFLCKLVYDLTHVFGCFYFKSYAGLSKIQRIEWNNRGISTIHAIFIAAMSVYFVFFSDLFSDDQLGGLLPFRNSPLSVFVLGVSVGYFISDLAMISWLYPSLGGMEYVLHHFLSLVAVAYSILSGEGQLYTYMVLISEATTPGINLRWYCRNEADKLIPCQWCGDVLCLVGKNSQVARVLLFAYQFYDVYLHYDQVEKMYAFGYFLVFVVPSILAITNFKSWLLSLLSK